MGRKISKAEKERREAARQEKAKKREYYKFMGLFLAAMAGVWLFGYFFSGVELASVPVQAKVESVEVTNTKFSDETKILTTDEELKLACTAFKLVRVQHEAPEDPQEPYLTLVYNMKNGDVKALQISENAAYWQGATKKLMRQEMVLEILDSAFFPEYVETENSEGEDKE